LITMNDTVRLHRTGTKHFRHPVVGELDLAFEAMDLCRQIRPDPHRLQRRDRAGQSVGGRPVTVGELGCHASVADPLASRDADLSARR